MTGARSGRPITVLVSVLTLGVMGALATARMPLQLVPPGLQSANLSVFIPVQESAPREVLEDVARPVEEAFRTIAGLTSVGSTSTGTGCRVRVEFPFGTDVRVIYADVRDRMERLLPTLPEGAERYRIRRFNPESDIPVMMLAVSFADDVSQPDTLVETLVRPRLEGVDGVAAVEIRGLVGREIEIELDPDRVNAHGVDLQRLLERLRADNLILPGGVVREGGARTLVRLASRLRSHEEIAAYPVTASLTVGDLGQVGERRALRDFVARVDGQLCLLAQVSRESEANIAATCERLRGAVRELEQDPRLSGFRFHAYLDQGLVIETAMAGLRAACAWGGLFAFLVLYVFLRRLTLTVVVAAAIPLSLLTAVVAMYFLDFTFNIVSLSGLTLGIGMLIDNAIVVAENIHRQRQLGLAAAPAARRGVREVALAVTLATLTTVAVFVPLVFLSGESGVGVMLRELGVPVCLALLASLAVALLVIPVAMAHLGERPRVARANGMLADRAMAASREVGAAASAAGASAAGASAAAASAADASAAGAFAADEAGRYPALLQWTLRHPVWTTLLALGFLASPLGAWFLMRAQGRGTEGVQRIEVEVRCPRHFSLGDTDAVMEQVRLSCEPLRDELGIKTMACWFNPQGGSFVYFLSPHQRITQEAFLLRIQPMLPTLAGVQYDLGRRNEDEPKKTVLEARGRDPAVLEQLLAALEKSLREQPGVLQVRGPAQRREEHVVIDVEREAAQRYQVNPGSVSNLVAWALRGAPLPDFHEPDGELPFWVRYAGSDLESLGELVRVPVYSRLGVPVAIGNLARFGIEPAFPAIQRVDGQVVSRLSVLLQPGAQIDDLRRAALARFATLEVPEGYELRPFEDPDETAGLRDVQGAGLLGLVLIFVILGVLFESVVLPLCVLCAVPSIFVGAYWAAYLLDSPMTQLGMAGFVILLGVAVNNAIVLVDCVNRFRAERRGGNDPMRGARDAPGVRDRALVAAARARLRPILMTTLTTIGGLLPLILFPQRGEGLDYRPLAVVVLGGLVSSTIFTLFAIPLAYALLDRLRGGLRLGASLMMGNLSTQPPPNSSR